MVRGCAPGLAREFVRLAGRTAKKRELCARDDSVGRRHRFEQAVCFFESAAVYVRLGKQGERGAAAGAILRDPLEIFRDTAHFERESTLARLAKGGQLSMEARVAMRSLLLLDEALRVARDRADRGGPLPLKVPPRDAVASG